MTISMGISTANMQASTAVYNVDTVAKQPHTKRDDVVAPIETSDSQAAKSDLSFIKMASPNLGQNLDIQV